MAWQRKIPFGYKIECGQAEFHPVEADAVRDIFRQYLSGLSYSQIAREMEHRGIKYHQHTEQWNKHMVKRILDNQTYLGGGQYPRLIDSGDFLAVRFQRDGKVPGAPRPNEIDPIRRKAVCALCGARMRRDTRTHGRPRWHCENPECGQTIPMEDSAVLVSLRERLVKLAQEPCLLTPPKMTVDDALSVDSIRIENELNLAFNRGSESAELIRMLIFASAAEAYAAIPDPTLEYQLTRLRERLEHAPADEDTLQDLLDTAVKAIRIGKGGTLELELVNGSIVNQDGKEQSA